MRCRRKWVYSSFNRDSLTPSTVTSGALDLGTLIHKSLADWIVARKYTQDEVDRLRDNKVEGDYTEGMPMSLPEIFNFHSAKRLEEIEANYIKITGGARPGIGENAILLDAIELGLAMMKNYIQHHGTAVPKHMTWVSPEQKVRIPIPGTTCEVCKGDLTYRGHRKHIRADGSECLDGCDDEEYLTFCPGCDGTGHHILEGTLDGLIQDKHGRLFILEHKTYARNPKHETLDTSDQFLAYLWCLCRLNIGPVGGLAYDGMWKRAVPPRGKTLSDLFIRKVLTRTNEEMEEFGEQLADLVTDMAEQPKIYMNRRWEGCTDCGYERLCIAQSRGEDIEYVRKTYYTERLREDPIGVSAEPDDE